MFTKYSRIVRIVIVNWVLGGVLVCGGVTSVAAQVLPPINDPSPGSTLTTTTVTFTGDVANQVGEQHWLSVETSPYANDIFHQSLGTGNVVTVGGLPTSGILHVRYHTYTPVAGWDSQAHTYTMNVSGDSGSGGGNTTAAVLAQIALLKNQLDSLKVDLKGVAQNWDKKLDSTNGEANGCNSERFTCLWPSVDQPDGAVVRDNETGLVWERSPDRAGRFWEQAIMHCAQREVGERKGWQLSTREQLASLMDPINTSPSLPTNHPFDPSALVVAAYWTTTTVVALPTDAWHVHLSEGQVGFRKKDIQSAAWCVRGGQNYDGQDIRNAIPSP